MAEGYRVSLRAVKILKVIVVMAAQRNTWKPLNYTHYIGEPYLSYFSKSVNKQQSTPGTPGCVQMSKQR